MECLNEWNKWNWLLRRCVSPELIDGHHVEGGVAEEHLGLPLRLLRGGGGLLQREARTRAHRGAEEAEAGGQDLHLQTPSWVP